jgi:hypothetical protein
VNSQPSTCPDAETLAAWSDHGLTPVEQRQVDAHVAGCARCLAYVAAMAKSDPIAAHPPVREWSWLNWRWIVPATAMLTAFGLWVAARPNQPAANAVNAPAAVAEPLAKAQQPASPPADAQAAAPVQAPQLRDRAATREDARAEAKDASPIVTAPPPAAAPAEPLAAAPSALNETVATRALAAPMAMRQADAIATTEIVSSDRAIRWRIRGLTIERSTDAGTTWTPQPTGARAPFTAGASPAPDVCWLVGRAGTVLVTTDGQTWNPVAFPETIDLVQVSATSAASATVTTSDARRFTTDDGGKTWKSGGLQDF